MRYLASSVRARPGGATLGGRGMNVALAGSGGGSTRRSDAHEEVSALQTQLDALGATLTHVQLISCEVPLDRASLASRSELRTLASRF